MTIFLKFCLCICLNSKFIIAFKKFYGDTNIEIYLKNIVCNNQNMQYHSIKWTTVLITNLNVLNSTKPKNISIKNFWFKYFHCFQFIINHHNSTEIIKTITKNKKISYKNVQIIFDFTFLPYINFENFKQIIIFLKLIYIECTNCSQLVVVSFKIVSNKCISLMQNVVKQHKPNFSMILTTLNSNLTVHVNPIIDGCRTKLGVYKFKSVSDYKQLKISYKNCNLNQNVLNISVNEAIPFCNLKKSNSILSFNTEYSIESKYIEYLSTKYKFLYNLNWENQVWGSEYIPDKNWYLTGIVGKLYNKVLKPFLNTLKTNLKYNFTDITNWIL